MAEAGLILMSGLLLTVVAPSLRPLVWRWFWNHHRTAPDEGYRNWWRVHRPVYDDAHDLLDRFDALLTQACRRPAGQPGDLAVMIADLSVIVCKSDQWHVDAVNLRRFHDLLHTFNSTISGPVRFSADRVRWHRQGVAAAQALALIPGVRDEIERQWGPGAWQGFTPAV
ncbi:hypothetical protein LX16_2812 [Stackebrandtia albiflava]|uniref:Uncharacterized protein n=2 Tax=Stackebrandtia albiflava TaxID=406432 RepID=A0A562V2F9_9ACTN|nr:hypothetical protein LX16_2812 [Stackebrandtia albiflava]